MQGALIAQPPKLQRFSPKAVLRLQLAMLGGMVIVAVVGVIVAADLLHRNVTLASNQSRSALVVSNGEAVLGDMLAILAPRASAYLSSPSFAALDPASQALVRQEIFRTDGAPASPNVPPVEVAVTLKDGISLQQLMDGLIAKSLPAFKGSRDTREINARAGLQLVNQTLATYTQQPTVTNYRALLTALVALRDQARDIFPELTTGAEARFITLEDHLNFGRLALVGGLIIIGLSAFVMMLITGRALQRTLKAAEDERGALAYRNSQLNALYTVFSEITDNLSLRYVVDATVRESLKLVRAHAVVLRLVRGQDLVVQGSLTDQEKPVEGLVTVQLGEGAVGRVARRGKTLLVNSVDEALSAGHWGEAMKSGIIVPLIVGARVVGTLGCWSKEAEAFGPEDQRVLEMMASQVATAVIAADSTEVSERRALLDPLTGLSNRRQLDEDLKGFLAELSDSGRSAALAMVDIDNFKRFNDEFGHLVGDVTLQKVAAVMRSSVRDSDRVYRYGGEEFVIVFVDADREEGIMLAERARAAVSSSPFTGDTLEPVGPITISIGLSFCPEHARDFGVLIELADQALYQSKQNGRNRVTCWRAPVDKLRLAA